MRSLLLSRWTLLCLAIFALVIAPFWRNLRDGIPDLLIAPEGGEDHGKDGQTQKCPAVQQQTSHHSGPR